MGGIPYSEVLRSLRVFKGQGESVRNGIKERCM